VLGQEEEGALCRFRLGAACQGKDGMRMESKAGPTEAREHFQGHESILHSSVIRETPEEFLHTRFPLIH
jgi:hypothetical protein